ncbi:helix-turn-helix domain-containing protein [Ruegeria pomeroyi]|nr:helix-turn-helix domain-containing protein [Ruegeria pomeroyi]
MHSIENFNLYGEAGNFPDVVHCETIEARSVIHDWEFQPHRHARLHQWLLLESGVGQVLLEEERHPLNERALVNIPAGCVHGFNFEPRTKGWVVTLAAELLEESLLESEGLRPHLMKPKILFYKDEIQSAVMQIFSEYAGRSYARAHVLRAYSSLLMGLVGRGIAELDPQERQTEHGLQRRFEALLDAHFLDHLGVSDYAKLMGITPAHLSRVMRAATGRSALSAIEERIVREARRNLAFSNISISEISYQLGYVDPTYFSRVFKRATGQSPRAFRKRLEERP